MRIDRLCGLGFIACILLQNPCGGRDASAAGEVTIYNQGSAQFEIAGDGSSHIYIDVIDPTVFEKEPSAEDILLVTHAHPDHYDRGFAESFPGKSLVIKEGELSFENGKVTSLASTHSDSKDDIPLPVNGINYILLLEINDLKIAHFGDIGQSELSKTQLDSLGKIDLAITQFVNPLSQMDMNNKKAFHLMEQLAPKIIIPTAHGRFSEDVVRHAKSVWNVKGSEEPSHAFRHDSLPQKTTLLIWGDGASFLMDDFELPEWKGRN
jgi:L-ascorbate metabolism protein UlaG (beta-lactamase superfamily)